MKVKDVIDKLAKIDILIDKLEKSDLDCASDIIWELTCYTNILKNAAVAKEV